MSDADDGVRQAGLVEAAGGEEVLPGEWNDDCIDLLPDPLTDALHRLTNAGYGYHVVRTYPVVTREMGESNRVSIVSLIETTAWPEDGPIEKDPPTLRVPVCSCQDFLFRRLPDEDDLRRATPGIFDVLTDRDRRCKHLRAIWPEIDDIGKQQSSDADPGGKTDETG